MITRKGLADEIDRLDEQLAEIQKEKAQMFAAYREQLENEGVYKPQIKAEIATIKLAIRRRRDLLKDPNSVTEQEALLDEILTEIRALGTLNAPRARARTPGPHPLDIPPYLART